MQVIIGIDLAGKPENPTGLALLEGKTVQSSLINTDEEPLKSIICNKPALTAIDAPFNPPKEGIQRKAERKMPEKGYRILPPSLAARRERALQAMKLSTLMANKGYKAIEVHSTSTRRVLDIPLKDWRKIQTILIDIGLREAVRTRTLVSHEIDAVTAALTAYLYLRGQTESIGDEAEGYITLPKKKDWRNLKV